MSPYVSRLLDLCTLESDVSHYGSHNIVCCMFHSGLLSSLFQFFFFTYNVIFIFFLGGGGVTS